jgi:hypothetical protein
MQQQTSTGGAGPLNFLSPPFRYQDHVRHSFWDAIPSWTQLLQTILSTGLSQCWCQSCSSTRLYLLYATYGLFQSCGALLVPLSAPERFRPQTHRSSTMSVPALLLINTNPSNFSKRRVAPFPPRYFPPLLEDARHLTPKQGMTKPTTDSGEFANALTVLYTPEPTYLVKHARKDNPPEYHQCLTNTTPAR